ncbi:hypothetical protein F4553_001096 [Allocatelliglobosispora scoriae]|uniref:Lipoprotein n=1 Tax=Allocatelliglobosispora scoriae TaxID=643052 RepID=A0A841BF52_9ACTN|nr:hypothetical protein [Allocatelliglobosispora scoriae]MBB5867717.1 hypothetical protein [Allocatelliglobosispora scoriae]
MTIRHTGLRATAAAAMLLAFVAGCDGTVDPSASASATAKPSVTASAVPSAKPSTSASASASASPSASPSSSLPPGMPGGTVNYSVTDWSIPSGAPIELGSSLGQFPSATLESIEIGKHPEGKPAFTRVSFRFKDALPSCRLLYVREFKGADDKSVLVEGNSKLAATFFTAGGPATGSVTPTGDGKPVVAGLVEVEDFEGYLGYGLGLQTAAQSDQVRLVRCGHLQYTDTRPAPYVVFVDIQG